MPAGAITEQIDVAQLCVAAFILFFVGLVIYLRREDKREGYPLEDPAGGSPLIGFPSPPAPKTFELMEGGTATMPHHDSPSEVKAIPKHRPPGSPLVPTGDPLHDSLGPASFALRRKQPLIYQPDAIQTLPMRELEGWSIAKGDADPRGMTVVGADGRVAGVVQDLWIDRGIKIIRYLEVEVTIGPEPKRVLLPIYHADVKRRRRRIEVSAATSMQFVAAPALEQPNRITAREEDQVSAFFAGTRFFRRPVRKVSQA